MPADLFSKKAREWAGRRESAVDADRRHRQHRRKREASHWTAGDGMLHLHAQFDPITGAAVVASLEERVDSLWRSDGGREGSPAEQAKPQPATSRRSRRAPHRQQSSCSTTPKAHGSPDNTSWPTAPPNSLTEHPCQDDVLRSLGPTAEVVGHVFDGDGRPLWLGRRTRLASADQWLALIAADRGCVDCGASASRCEAHHNVTEWSHGGPTNIDKPRPPLSSMPRSRPPTSRTKSRRLSHGSGR